MKEPAPAGFFFARIRTTGRSAEEAASAPPEDSLWSLFTGRAEEARPVNFDDLTARR
jgi:hypothetical protein